MSSFQDGLVFVVGRRTAQLSVSGRHHSADDIIGMALQKFVRYFIKLFVHLRPLR